MGSAIDYQCKCIFDIGWVELHEERRGEGDREGWRKRECGRVTGKGREKGGVRGIGEGGSENDWERVKGEDRE